MRRLINFCQLSDRPRAPHRSNAATAELAKTGALAALGIEPVAETAAQFKTYIAAEVKEGAELLKDAGFTPE